MKEDLEGEVGRLAAFIGAPLPAAKLASLTERVSLGSMAERKVITVRKCVVGDWQEHLTAQDWAAVDDMFQERLGDVPLVAGLRRFM